MAPYLHIYKYIYTYIYIYIYIYSYVHNPHSHSMLSAEDRPPHGGVRPSHQTSTCITQLTSGPHVVQIWSCSTPEFGVNETRVVHRVVCFVDPRLLHRVGAPHVTEPREPPPPFCPLDPFLKKQVQPAQHDLAKATVAPKTSPPPRTIVET